MDIALCVLDKTTNKLQFSGAYNPLIIIRNTIEEEAIGFEKKIESEGKTLFEFKADRMPIGKFKLDTISFKTQEVQLLNGDAIYTFTDGFQDQFGGLEGKKYMVKRMKNLLLSIQNESMKKQESLLIEEFKGWLKSGNTVQIDDVCIVGVQIE